mmetsp:Transcript_7837/g.24014  ORF Transcript_7837/g.24014 Transcript_7837/m.24014 type:complete len:238 (-) Transcript_7837:190-903(-)
MNMLNLGTSRKPSTAMPQAETMERSWTLGFLAEGPSCSPKSAGSRSTQRSTLKAEMPTIFERSTLLRVQVMTLAKRLIEVSVSSIASSSAGVTRSTLLRRTRSAKATCCTASLTAPSGLTSSRCALTCFASARQMTASMTKLSSIHWFDLIVAMIGAGSARPVVSRRTQSNCFRFSTREPSVRTRSPRIEQHAHPLSILIRSSLVAMFSPTSFSSMLISPYSFSITQIRLSFCSFRM